jgi:hypothetical protein
VQLLLRNRALRSPYVAASPLRALVTSTTGTTPVGVTRCVADKHGGWGPGPLGAGLGGALSPEEGVCIVSFFSSPGIWHHPCGR